MRELQSWLDRADELAAAGRYFDAHEELETPWKEASGDEKIVLQGLIQLAAGLHRLRLDPTQPDGAFYLLDRGLEKLNSSRALLVLGTLATLASRLKKIRASGKAPETLLFGLRAI